MSDDSGSDADEGPSLRAELSNLADMARTDANRLLRLLAQVAWLDPEQRAALFEEDDE
jgi:isopenicillin N synthase-like dioxygenase